MPSPKDHFIETGSLARQLNPFDVGSWLLHGGFFPEQYILPPCFDSTGFTLKPKPNYPLKQRNKKLDLKPDVSELLSIAFPKSTLSDRVFSIYDPRHYHDLSWHIHNNWAQIVGCLFHPEIEIYSYSFPIPIDRKHPGQLGSLRAGRMIYEYLEMAENDLVDEAYRYTHIFKTDVANFYPSIYTHSIAWAIDGKTNARKNRTSYDTLGKVIDRLVQYANDQCTNGLGIGPAVSDLISEVVLAAVDRDCSARLKRDQVDFVGVRFKDDYRFLTTSVKSAERISAALRYSLREYNLTLNEGKSEIKSLPEGIFREWTSRYHSYSLRHRSRITYKQFERTILAVIDIDKDYPGTGAIDRFLSELSSRGCNLKLALRSPKERCKAFSLLLLLRRRRAKAFPTILSLIEAMLTSYPEDKSFKKHARLSLNSMLREFDKKREEHEYEILWITYFQKTVLVSKAKPRKAYSNPLLESVNSCTQLFFTGLAPLFKMPAGPVPKNHLLKHLGVFRRHVVEEEVTVEEDHADVDAE